MKRMPTLCLAVVLSPIGANAYSFHLSFGTAFVQGVQTPAPPSTADPAFPISTERPSFSDSSSLVPLGHPQLEFGSTYTSFGGSHALTVGEVLFRYAVASRFELRMSNGTFASVTQGNTVMGFQDPSVSFKYKLLDGVFTGPNRRPDIAFVGSTTLPGGSNAFRVIRSQSTGILAWSYGLNSTTSVGGNCDASDLGPNGAQFTQYASSLYVSRSLTPAVTLSYEVYGLFPVFAGGPNAGFTDVIVTYLLNQRTQLDFRLGTGFNSSRDGTWIGAGVSYRF
jgi:hypothetical protein